MAAPPEPHHLLRFLEARPDHALAFQSLGKWYRGRGRLDEAETAWARSLALDPCDVFTHLYLGNLFMALGDWEGAEIRFQYAAELRPEEAAPLWCLADLDEARGRDDLAEDYHRRSVEVCPDDDQAARLMEEWRARHRLRDDR